MAPATASGFAPPRTLLNGVVLIVAVQSALGFAAGSDGRSHQTGHADTGPPLGQGVHNGHPGQIRGSGGDSGHQGGAEDQKFGLAWLFANIRDKERIKERTQQASSIGDLKPGGFEDTRVAEGSHMSSTAIILEASKGENHRIAAKNRKFSMEDVQDETFSKHDLICHHQDDQGGSVSKLEASEGDSITLRCTLQDVHHEIDFKRFQIEWSVSEGPQTIAKDSSNDPGEETACQTPEDGSRHLSRQNRVLDVQVPLCKVYTEFPFEDLTTSSKDISCTAELILPSVTVNDTGLYTCRARMAFETIGPSGSASRGGETTTYLMSENAALRVSRADSYHVHKVVSVAVGSIVLVVIAVLMTKRIRGHRLGWETKADNYSPEWPNAVPARRIASSGSFGNLVVSKSNSLRRSGDACGCIEEECQVVLHHHHHRQPENEIIDIIKEEDEEDDDEVAGDSGGANGVRRDRRQTLEEDQHPVG